MKGIATLLTQAWNYWQSDSRAESVIAVAMAGLTGIALFEARIRSILGRVI